MCWKSFLFFGPEDWRTIFRVTFSLEQLDQISQLPWGVDILRSTCRLCGNKGLWSCHSAFLGLETLDGVPLDILHLSTLQRTEPNQLHFSPRWHEKEACVGETLMFGWHLVHNSPVFLNQTFNEQEQLLIDRGYEVSSTVARYMQIFLAHEKTRSFMSRGLFARCSNITTTVPCSDVHHIIVGVDSNSGIIISATPNRSHPLVGVAATLRKF